MNAHHYISTGQLWYTKGQYINPIHPWKDDNPSFAQTDTKKAVQPQLPIYFWPFIGVIYPFITSGGSLCMIMVLPVG